MIEDYQKAKEEEERKIENEKRERENSNNSLLNLLEESCNRIEAYFAQCG